MYPPFKKFQHPDLKTNYTTAVSNHTGIYKTLKFKERYSGKITDVEIKTL